MALCNENYMLCRKHNAFFRQQLVTIEEVCINWSNSPAQIHTDIQLPCFYFTFFTDSNQFHAKIGCQSKYGVAPKSIAMEYVVSGAGF